MLYLYRNITPNYNDKHYYFTNISTYRGALASNLIESVNIDNYRINTNIIKVTLSNTITEAVADTITYAIDERSGYFRAYHVNSVLIQSGYVILNCSIDLWASYLYNASFTNFNIMRCNRNVGVGLLDEIKGTHNAPSRSYCAVSGYSTGDNNEYYDITKVYCVFALKFNIQQNSAGAVSRIKLFAVSLYDIKLMLFNANGGTFAYSIVNPVELVQDFVAGIYGIEGSNMWGISGTLNAVVLGAWLTDLVAVTSQNNVTIKSKANWVNFTDVSIMPYEVITSEVTRTMTITNDFDKQLYIGTRQNGLKLQRTTEATISVNIKCIPSTDKLTIIAMQGDNQEDITNAFALTLGTADGDVTAERQALEVVQNSIKFIGAGLALAKGVSSGEALAGVIGMQGVANTIAGSMERSTHIGSMVKGGDGAIAFYRIFTGQDTTTPLNNLSTPITNPYVINAYASINDEKVNARLYGAKFSEKLAGIDSVFTYSLLGTGNNDDATFIQASCNVNNIPTDASDVIKTKLQNGVYVISL